MQDDPLAYFLTWPTYGTWLPGDERGWVEHKHGWQLPDDVKKLEAAARMSEDVCMLSERERITIEEQVAETCKFRGWHLHAVNCRTNHIHIVVSAPDTSPTKVRNDIKAWCTRRLKEKCDPNRENWWAERGSQRYINDETGLEAATIYTTEGQERKGEPY